MLRAFTPDGTTSRRFRATPKFRAFRIGQTRNVQVHRFITKGTFEEKINALLETKKSIANMTVSAGETWLADMDDKQLGEVFGLDNTLV